MDDLSALAQHSYPAARARDEADCSLRNPFQRDRDRIVHSKAFRRLKHKTQVFVAPTGDHFRTRLTHTLEVTGIARTVARALGLNEDLTEAIGLGHDLGHPPFGHIGEAVLDRCRTEHDGQGFRHFEHSLRVVTVLEPLNLTEAVRDGILCHSGRSPTPSTLEGKIVRLVDRIGYLNHDIDDAVRAGVLDAGDLPAGPIAFLGDTGSARIDTLVHDLVKHSAAAGDIVQGDDAAREMDALREFMFAEVYLGDTARAEHAKIETVLRGLWDWYLADPDRLGGRNSDTAETGVDDEATPTGQRVVDYVAGMTDRFAVSSFQERFVPRGFDA